MFLINYLIAKNDFALNLLILKKEREKNRVVANFATVRFSTPKTSSSPPPQHEAARHAANGQRWE